MSDFSTGFGKGLGRSGFFENISQMILNKKKAEQKAAKEEQEAKEEQARKDKAEAKVKEELRLEQQKKKVSYHKTAASN